MAVHRVSWLGSRGDEVDGWVEGRLGPDAVAVIDLLHDGDLAPDAV